MLQNAIAQEAPNVTSCKTSPDPRPPPAKSGADEYIDLSTSWVAVKLREYLKFFNASSANHLIGQLTKSATGIPGLLRIPGSLIGVNSSTNISGVQADLQLGRLNLDVGNISFAGLDTLTNLTLFETPAPYKVENTLTIGWPEPLVPRPTSNCT